jgi:FkbH-like protein
MTTLPATNPAVAAVRPPKCVVWDLDDTLWRGTLLEGDAVGISPGIRETLAELDARGIVHSIASRNDPQHAIARLRELGVDEYFLYPQIGWGAKSEAIARIAAALNIGVDAIAFVDDQPFERDEVAFAHPVLCLDPEPLHRLLDLPELNPRFLTEDSRLRRVMYQQDASRKAAESEYRGPSADFLRTLEMRFEIDEACEADLQRAEELTVRTHQLNTTGYTYSYEDLDAYRQSDRHKLLIASLTDRFGPYGKIGLTLVECGDDAWTIKLLLMSCRVMSRGVGSVLLGYLMGLAREAGVPLRAEFKSNGRNRMMYVTYRFAHFEEVARDGDVVVLENDCRSVPACPDYVDLRVPRLACAAAI